MGLSYYVRVEGTVTLPGGTVLNINEYNVSFQIFGPITDAGITTTPSGGYIAYVDGRNSSGNPQRFQLAGGCCWSPAPTCVTTAVTITTRFGGPDSCGDPPPPPEPPPTSSTGSTNITYIDGDDTEITVPINFVFGFAYVDANLNINIPIRLSFETSFNPSFSANANLSTGDINFNFGNTNIIHPPDGTTTAPDAYNTDGDTPAQPPDTPGDPSIPPNDTQDDETTRVISGVIVTVTDINQNLSEVFQDDNPTIYIPRLGNVQFLIQVGNRIAWTTDIPVRNRRHFIPCPWEGGAIDVRGTPVPNVEFSLTKVYKRSQEAVTYVT